MANYKAVEIDALESKLTAIGNAIRSKTGDAELLTLEDMATSINGIKNADDYLADVMDKRITELVNYKMTGTLPSNFQKGNTNLVKVDLPLVIGIGEGVFANCNKLVSLNLPSAQEINAGVFNACHSLATVYFPELTRLYGYGYSFSGCINLTKAVFPKLTSQFTTYDFHSCRTLTALVLGANTVCPLANANNVFANTPIANGTGYIYVPRAQLEAYKSATNWSAYASQFRAIEDYPGIMEV